MKKLDLKKYRVFKEYDGSIGYARWWKGNHIGASTPCQGRCSYNLDGADVPDQWRALDPKKHHKVVGELKKLVKEGKIKVEPVTDSWGNIDPFNPEFPKVLGVTYLDGEWCNALSPKQYYSLKRMSSFFTAGFFLLWIIIVMCLPY